MKKISILGVCALVGLGAMAQETVLKDAEKLMKKGVDFTEVVEAITPAMSNPETKDNAATYYIPGKAAYNQYDKILGAEMLSTERPDDQQVKKGKALQAGYKYFMQALPLDTVIDAKGKEKTKYSKEIVNTIAGHLGDMDQGAAILYQVAQDYQGAYDLWDDYVAISKNPLFAKALGNNVPADTILANVRYNQGLTALQMQNNELAAKAFSGAIDLGYRQDDPYKPDNVYDYALFAAQNAGDKALLDQLARKAYAKYGSENPNYIGLIINGYMDRKEYDQAIAMIDEAIQNFPNNSQYHVIKGIIYEQEGVNKDPLPEYQKAVDIDPNNGSALYELGRIYYNKAQQIYNDAPNDDAAFTKVYNEDYKPVILVAVDYLERSYAANNDNINALKLLENAYYQLNDEANYKATQARLAGE